MYGRFTYIYHKKQPNVGKYTSPMVWYGLYDFPNVLWEWAISLRASAVQFGRCIRELTPVVRSPGKWWCILGVQIFRRLGSVWKYGNYTNFPGFKVA